LEDVNVFPDWVEGLVERYSSEAEFLDVRISYGRNLFLSTENGKLRSLDQRRGVSLGVRVLRNGFWGIASTDILEKDRVEEAFRKAISVAGAGGKVFPGKVNLSCEKAYRDRKRVHVKKSFDQMNIEDKQRMILELDRRIGGVDKRIITTRVVYSEGFSRRIYLNSEGAFIEQVIPGIHVLLFSIAREAMNMQMYYASLGGEKGLELLDEADLYTMAENVGREAVNMLAAKSIKGGFMPVIMDGRVAGTFAHEVFGHAAEADNVVNAKSFLSGLVGRKIGSDEITIVDDATIEGAYGSYFYDDEGVPSQRKVLLEKGVLKGYMHSRETAGVFGVKSTGNARAQGSSSRIYVRMSNTFIEPGDWTLEEMVEDIDYGVYVTGAMGGMEDPIGGGFQVSALKAVLIEKGEMKHLLKAVTISGKALEILKNVDAVGKDFTLEPGLCGKGYSGDRVPVTTGGPSVRVKKMLVGVSR